jgi:hypothetical protein
VIFFVQSVPAPSPLLRIRYCAVQLSLEALAERQEVRLRALMKPLACPPLPWTCSLTA